MQNQKWKLKIEIQKSNSKMGIVLINSKTKFNFPSGLAFLFCESIITQPFGFVNRCKKFFYAHLHNQLHYHLQIQKQPHLHWYNHIHIHIHLHTTWRFCVYLLMSWWVNVPVLSVHPCVYIPVKASAFHISTEFYTWVGLWVYGLIELCVFTHLNPHLWR